VNPWWSPKLELDLAVLPLEKSIPSLNIDIFLAFVLKKASTTWSCSSDILLKAIKLSQTSRNAISLPA
jgi:hypothetical protein